MDEMSDAERDDWHAKWVELIRYGEIRQPDNYEPLTRLQSLIAGMPQTVVLTSEERHELLYDLDVLVKKRAHLPATTPRFDLNMSLQIDPDLWGQTGPITPFQPARTRVEIAPAP